MCINPAITLGEWNRISTIPAPKDSPEAQLEAMTIERDILKDECDGLLDDVEYLNSELRYSQMESDCLAQGFARTIAEMLEECNPANSPDIATMAGNTIRSQIIREVMNRFLATTRDIATEIRENYEKEDAG